jgi:hypothetical protein
MKVEGPSWELTHDHRRSEVVLPLTPALSLRERENCAQRLYECGAPGVFERLPSCPPLPKGEGRGEGEQGAHPWILVPAMAATGELRDKDLPIGYTSAC